MFWQKYSTEKVTSLSPGRGTLTNNEYLILRSRESKQLCYNSDELALAIAVFGFDLFDICLNASNFQRVSVAQLASALFYYYYVFF